MGKELEMKQLAEEQERIRIRKEEEEAKRKKELEDEMLKEKQVLAELEKQRRDEEMAAIKEAEEKAVQEAQEEAQRIKLAEEEALIAQRLSKQKEERRLSNSSSIISRNLSSYVSRKKVQASSLKIIRWFRAYRPLIRARIFGRGVRRMQAVLRARIVRAHRGVKVSKICDRLSIAAANARTNPDLRLGKRTLDALETLQNGRVISQLFKACHLLELSTRVSEKCASAFADAKAPKILFSLIQSCNRSAPHQEILRYALVILLHVARYEQFAPVVAAADNSTEVVIHLMQMFRDKGQIFCLSCELLCRLVEANDGSKNACNYSTSRKCLDGILHIIESKHRLQSRVSAVVAKKGVVENACISPKGKAKYLASEEPVNCIRHLMYLLDRTCDGDVLLA